MCMYKCPGVHYEHMLHNTYVHGLWHYTIIMARRLPLNPATHIWHTDLTTYGMYVGKRYTYVLQLALLRKWSIACLPVR